MQAENLLNKFIGALIGTAVGDALGAPVEGCDKKTVRAIYGHDRDKWEMISGRYTDDTEMMIGVAESLVERRGFDGEHMARQFIANYDATRGYGPGPREALRWISLGERWDRASRKLFNGKGSYGNGAAMRIAPVGIFYHDNIDKLCEIAYKTSIITHAHELGIEGAILQASAVAIAIRGNRDRMLIELEKISNSSIYKNKLKKIEEFLRDETPEDEVIATLGNGEEAFNSVPTAIYSFLRSISFKDAVTYAISLGGDTDTIGAMTGAISGAYYGFHSIPQAWVIKLEEGEKGRSYIKSLAERLYFIKYKV
ncbi:MAG: ADP-ribosylglycohydrolase family protein [Candidatus Methanospirareceae archaeon]